LRLAATQEKGRAHGHLRIDAACRGSHFVPAHGQRQFTLAEVAIFQRLSQHELRGDEAGLARAHQQAARQREVGARQLTTQVHHGQVVFGHGQALRGQGLETLARGRQAAFGVVDQGFVQLRLNSGRWRCSRRGCVGHDAEGKHRCDQEQARTKDVHGSSWDVPSTRR
jgi:hypothetical protein